MAPKNTAKTTAEKAAEAGAKLPTDHQEGQEKQRHDPSEKFVYTCDAGTFTLPYIENLTRGFIKGLNNLTRQVQAGELEEDAVDEYLFGGLLAEGQYETLDDISLWDQEQLMTQWNEQSAMSLGE
ncbi:hypothetical protein CRM73_00130 [Kocuria sp. CCUG 69068]|uniref:hypothetical protein n=1 Tax=Kocuria sp. CCUG 69068 TaxID=2043138 RepID=UPI001E505A14|nr:hypothetical protein [Kocuria sp. CCUG 69068]